LQRIQSRMLLSSGTRDCIKCTFLNYCTICSLILHRHISGRTLEILLD